MTRQVCDLGSRAGRLLPSPTVLPRPYRNQPTGMAWRCSGWAETLLRRTVSPISGGSGGNYITGYRSGHECQVFG